MKVIMENCQVWPYFELELRPQKIMLPVAENDEGKSVWLKVLRCALLGKYDGHNTYSDIIRRGTNFAKFSLTFDDGRIWKVTITKKDIRHTLQDSEDDKPKTYYATSGQAPEEVLTFLNVYVIPELNYVSWIIDPEDMLVGVKTTPSQNFKIFSPILRPKHLLKKRQELVESLEESKRRIQVTNKIIDNTKRMLQRTPYIDVETVEKRLTKNTEDKEKIIQYYQPISNALQYINKINELSNMNSEELYLCGILSSSLYDRQQLGKIKKLDGEELTALTSITNVVELRNTLSSLPNVEMINELNSFRVASDVILSRNEINKLSDFSTDELQLLAVTAQVVEADISLKALSNNCVTELDSLSSLATVLQGINELNSLTVNSVEELQLLSTLVKVVETIEQLNTIPDTTSITEIVMLSSLATVLQGRIELSSLSSIDVSETDSLTRCVEILELQNKVNSLGSTNQVELELLTISLDIIRAKVAITAHTKNIRIAEQKLLRMQEELNTLRDKLDESSRVAICPKCGYDLRDENMNAENMNAENMNDVEREVG